MTVEANNRMPMRHRSRFDKYLLPGREYRKKELYMTRRQILATPLLLGASALRAQTRYREYSRCGPDYLAALAADAYARRNARIAALKTPTAIRDYQA